MRGYVAICCAAWCAACSAPEPATDAGRNPAPDTGPAADAGESPTVPDATHGVRFEDRPVPGRWYGGDFHVHATGASNDTGGESFPERIKEVAIAHGLDFVVLTDHSNSTGSDPTTRDEDPELFNQGPEFPYWDRAAELSDESFLMVDGNEISPVDEPAAEPTGHLGCYPRSLENFNPNIAFIDRPRGEVTSAETVPQARAAGCFVTVNHPFVATFWMAFDWTTRDYDGMEVFNGGGGWDKFDYEGVLGWACDLSLGKRTTAVGGSDNHRVNTEPPGTVAEAPIGWPTTYLWSGTLQWPGLIASLDRGRVTISDTGTPLEIDVYDENGGWLGFAGSEVDAEDVRHVRVRGALANSEGEARILQIARIRAGSCNDTREEFELTVPEIELDVVAEYEIEADTAFDHAVQVEDLDASDALFGWLRPRESAVIGLHGAAITNAVHLR